MVSKACVHVLGMHPCVLCAAVKQGMHPGEDDLGPEPLGDADRSPNSFSLPPLGKSARGAVLHNGRSCEFGSTAQVYTRMQKTGQGSSHSSQPSHVSLVKPRQAVIASLHALAAAAEALDNVQGEFTDGASPARRGRKKGLVTYGDGTSRSLIQASLDVDQREREMVRVAITAQCKQLNFATRLLSSQP